MKRKQDFRKDRRRTCLVPVDTKSESAFDRVKTVDISQKGIGLISNYPMPVNDDVAVQIDLTPQGESIVIWGRVKWVQRINKSGNYRIGIGFSNFMSGGSPRRLKTYMK